MTKTILLSGFFFLLFTVFGAYYVWDYSAERQSAEYISFYQYIGEEIDMVCKDTQDLLDGTLLITDYIDVENDRHIIITEMQLTGQSKVTDYELNIGKLMYRWTEPGTEGFVQEQEFAKMEDAPASLLEAIEEGWSLTPEQCKSWEVDSSVFIVPEYITFKEI